MAVELFSNIQSWTVGAGGITNVATSLPTSGAAAGNLAGTGQFRIIVTTAGQSELMIVTAGQTTSTWTVTRGAEGTTAIAHNAGDPITYCLTDASLKRLVEGRPVAGDADGSWDLSAGGNFYVPKGAGKVPGTEGGIVFDTTKRMLRTRDSIFGSSAIPETLSLGKSTTDTKNSSVQTEQLFATSQNVPANYFIDNKVLMVLLSFVETSGSGTVPTSTYRLKLGTTIMWSGAVVWQVSKTDWGSALMFLLIGTAAPANPAGIEVAGPFGNYESTSAFAQNQNAPRINVDTTAAQTLQFSVQYSAAGTGTNSTTLRVLQLVELF